MPTYLCIAWKDTQATIAYRTKKGVNARIASGVLPALLDKSTITHFGDILFTNPDRFSLAQSSYNPDDFGSRKGAGHAIFSARVLPGRAFASAISEMKTYKSKFNQGGVIDAHELTCALEDAVNAEADVATDLACTVPTCVPGERFGQRKTSARVKARARYDGLVADDEDDGDVSPGLLFTSCP
jgi:hypothetical protein